MSQQIKLTDIRLAGTNTRVQLDRQAVADYGDQLDEGSPLPPIDLYHDPLENPEVYWLGDGWHRLTVAAEREHETIDSNIHKGGKREALEHSIRSNWSHGVRRSHADKRNAVKLALADAVWSQWSNAQLAKFCGVGDKLVAAVRDELKPRETEVEAQVQSETLVGKDGVRRPRTPRKAVASAPVAAPHSGGKSTEFDPAKLEKQSKAKNGRPAVSRKTRSKVQKSLGDLIRGLKEMDLYEQHADALTAIAESLKNV